MGSGRGSSEIMVRAGCIAVECKRAVQSNTTLFEPTARLYGDERAGGSDNAHRCSDVRRHWGAAAAMNIAVAMSVVAGWGAIAATNIAVAMPVVAGVLGAAAMNIAVAMPVVAGVLGAAAMNIAVAMSAVAGVLAWLRFRAVARRLSQKIAVPRSYFAPSGAVPKCETICCSLCFIADARRYRYSDCHCRCAILLLLAHTKFGAMYDGVKTLIGGPGDQTVAQMICSRRSHIASPIRCSEHLLRARRAKSNTRTSVSRRVPPRVVTEKCDSTSAAMCTPCPTSASTQSPIDTRSNPTRHL